MTQASVKDVQREAFERWALSRGHVVAKYKAIPDMYLGTFLNAAWEGYQAALSAQPKAVSVEEAENRGLRNGLALGWRLGQDNDTETLNKTMAAYEREAREMRESKRQTAIIGEGD